LISLLFNWDFYDCSNKTNKELAIRSINSKLKYEDNEIGYVKGFMFDFKLIGGPKEEDLQLFKKQSDEEIYSCYGDNMDRDEMINILDIIDENDYEKFVEKHCFTESDYESFLEEHDLEDVSQFAEDHRYVILIQEINIANSYCNLSEREVLDTIKETLYIIFDVSDCVVINSNYEKVVMG
jgi:predicted house-cleaning noncanonical NTP pyrophosphatase (MazG superfamily)